ncbi:zinc-binding dehydrogenase [Ferrimicrobium acidiphilum]|uniref:zinc-binding dehydrogenase n=1 Tax=Ferrimicrobium acidiphilum TaxID=121039 RepID=UPI0023F3E98B|nr:zinc-binding dehydrogenase [Ferrimicrobium acidiphilum]MCL5053652.1 zinc-binding dehydrogenase [Gammaproteobacteria bacterium]
MRALIARNGSVIVEEVATPQPARNELLIKVTSAGINAADLLQARGHYPPPAGFDPERLGLEFAGEVIEAGSSELSFQPGQFVMGVTGGGAHAEFLTAPASACIPVPASIDPMTAGGFPEAAFTALDALIVQANLSIGDRLLVHGALGGVGTAAVQLGALLGAEVVAVVRNHEQDARALSLGARNSVTPDEISSSGPYDVILELVSGENLATNMNALATNGRIVVIGVGSGAKTQIDLRLLMGKRGTLRASTLRARSWEEKALLASRVEHHLLSHLATGAYRILVEEQFNLADGAEAYDRFSKPGKFGKIILTTE